MKLRKYHTMTDSRREQLIRDHMSGLEEEHLRLTLQQESDQAGGTPHADRIEMLEEQLDELEGELSKSSRSSK